MPGCWVTCSSQSAMVTVRSVLGPGPAGEACSLLLALPPEALLILFYSVLFCSDRLEGGSVYGISAISISTSVLENGISPPPPLKLPNLFTVLCLLYPVSLLI